MSLMKREDGFTIIELLIAIVILGIIIVPLGAGVNAVLHNSNATNQRLVESHDAQIAAAYFAEDVQSADVTNTSAAGSYTLNTTSACDKPGNTPVVRLAWSELNVTGTVSVFKLVVYSTESTGIGKPPLMRRLACQGPSSSSLNPTTSSDAVIAHNLQSTTSWSLSNTSCPEGFKTLTLSVTETSTYNYQVSGTRRTATC